MTATIENFLANVNSLHQLKAKNLPEDVLEDMIKMETNELYKLCTQFIVLQHNVPSEDKMITMEEDELLTLVDEYAKELLERFRG
jgi:hypothetical protein